MNRVFIIFLIGSEWLPAQTGVELQLASAARQRTAMESMTGSLRLQRASVRSQIRLVTAKEPTYFVTMDSVEHAESAVPADCDSLPAFEARSMVESAARTADIDPNLLQAVAEQESAFRPCAVSNKGAQGVMQLMPATALQLGVQNPFNASESLAGGAMLLKQLITRYAGDLNRVLGAYNAGPARVDAADGIPPIPETIRYVEKILGKLP